MTVADTIERILDKSMTHLSKEKQEALHRIGGCEQFLKIKPVDSYLLPHTSCGGGVEYKAEIYDIQCAVCDDRKMGIDWYEPCKTIEHRSCARFIETYCSNLKQ